MFTLFGTFFLSVLYILINSLEDSFGKLQSLRKPLEGIIIQEDLQQRQVEQIKFLIKIHDP